MNLSKLILDNIEQILQEWENFASTIFTPDQKDRKEKLRDHAKKMLLVIATDLNEFQSKSEQTAKSRGLQLREDPIDTAAEKHGIARMEDGFDINEIISEYRALRASVTKHFTLVINEKIPADDITDLVRFNEAIDQAITESVASYAYAVEQKNRLFDTMLSSTPDLSFTLDLEGKFLYVNRAMIDLYQIPAHEILGTAVYNFAMPSAPKMMAYIQDIIKTNEVCRGEVTFHTLSEEARYFECVFAPVFDKKGRLEAIAGVSRDISERKSAEERIWQNANYDSLTGLVNRRLFREKLKQVLKSSKRSGKVFALLFIDLDKFKNVNDTFGHNAGDLLLKQAAKRINGCIRDTDTLARVGGDEFTVILEDVHDAEQVRLTTVRITTALEKTFTIKKQKIKISASIGITLSPQDGVEPDTLVRNADRAMYIAKNEGVDRLRFYSVLGEHWNSPQV